MGVCLVRKSSVNDPDPGSDGFFDPWIRDPKWVFSGSRISDPGNQTHIRELSDNFLGKKFYNSLKIGPNFFLQHFKNKIIYNFMKLMATKRYYNNKNFHPFLLLLFLDPRCGIRDG
jgi:hypothetical protein